MYASLFRNVLFPLYETGLRGRETLRALDELEQSQWRSPEAVAEASFQSMLEALRHAEKHVPFYRKRFAEYGVSVDRVQSPEDLASFPVLTKDDVRKHGAELVADTHREAKLHLSATSGSTGQPMRFYYDHRTYELRVAGMMRSNRWAGADFGDKELHIWSRSFGDVPKKEMYKRAVHTAVLRQKYISAFDLRLDKMDDMIREIAEYEPRVIISYSTPLYMLARYALERGIQLPQPRGIITSAERLFQPQREAIERAFGAPVFDRYGCREVMLIASECEKHDGMHINAENVYVEICRGDKPAPAGTPGVVVVTDLRNRATPLIRYRNEDVATLKKGACACGRGLPLLGSLEGRVLDMIVGSDGHIVAGEVFPHLLKDMPIERFQVYQGKDHTVTLKIVPGQGFDDEVAARIRQEMRVVLGDRANLAMELVRDIPLTASGKHRVAISEVGADLATTPVVRPVETKAATVSTKSSVRTPRARVAHVVLALRMGGLEQVVLRLIERLDRERFEPIVCALEEEGDLASHLKRLDVPIHLIPRSPGLDPSVAVRLASFLQRERVQIVHTHNPSPHLYGALAAAIARREGPDGRALPRVVHTKHGRNYPGAPRKVLANRLASALSDKIVAVSEDAHRVALELEHVDAHRLVTIRNGVDTELFRPDDPVRARRALGVPTEGLHIGCVARLSKEKDHATMLEAFAAVRARRPDAHLTLVGDGAERAALEAQRDRLGLAGAVTFAGQRDDIAAILPAFDMFALSSRTEGMSLTLLEAAAAGLPIVATRVGGNPEVVADGETGLLVPAGDPARFAEALLATAARPDLRAMGERARARVAERYDMGRTAAAYDALYAEVLRLS
ncbi:glycosyltransferase [Polyangium aurulentum]|uniref:glycosyltransferase n=1 Tax=Polyangium aurulentum TaxID=2567896 RepID=UPI001F255C10|nr:glycosyltransferase [Polyangium aurulentum]